MRVNSELMDAQLENKSSDVTPATTAKGLIYYKSTNEPIKVSDGTTVHKVLTDQMGADIKASLPATNYQLSSSSGSFNTSSSTYVDVTNLSVTITTTGRPVQISLVNGYISAASFSSSQSSGMIKVLRNSTDVGAVTLGATQNEALIDLYIPSGAVGFVDAPAAGTYTYKIQAKKDIGSSVSVEGVKLFVREIL